MGRQTERYRDYLAYMKHIEWTIYSFFTAVFIERFIDRVGAKVDTFVSQLELQLQRGKAQATKSRLVSVLSLIGSESGVTFLDQPHNEVKQNQTIKDYLWDSIEDCPFLLIDWWIDWLIDWLIRRVYTPYWSSDLSIHCCYFLQQFDTIVELVDYYSQHHVDLRSGGSTSLTAACPVK